MATGRAYQQTIKLCDPITGETKRVRRVTVKLKSLMRDGDMEIHLLTNLPASRVSSVKVAKLYQKRWPLQAAFNEMTLHLRCQLNMLGYPKSSCVRVLRGGLLLQPACIA